MGVQWTCEGLVDGSLGRTGGCDGSGKVGEVQLQMLHYTVGPTSGEKGRLSQLFPKCSMAFPYEGLIFNTS